MSFSLDVAKFAKKTELNIDEATRFIILKLFGGVIIGTRVDTGRLRGNWQTTASNPAANELDRKDKYEQNAPGGKAWDEMERKVDSGVVNYLTNNLPYAEVWDEVDGTIEKNMARIQRNIKEAIRNVS